MDLYKWSPTLWCTSMGSNIPYICILNLHGSGVCCFALCSDIFLSQSKANRSALTLSLSSLKPPGQKIGLTSTKTLHYLHSKLVPTFFYIFYKAKSCSHVIILQNGPVVEWTCNKCQWGMPVNVQTWFSDQLFILLFPTQLTASIESESLRLIFFREW